MRITNIEGIVGWKQESNKCDSVDIDVVARWIKELGNDGLMLTISKPHAKALKLTITDSHMHHVLNEIIRLANQFVFGKHKHFEFLRGLVVVEGGPLHPHYHIVFAKPDSMDRDRFKRKLEQLASKLCNHDFVFDLSHVESMSEAVREALERPCYQAFARVTETHSASGTYLTKQHNARFHWLQGRGYVPNRDRIDIQLRYSKPSQETAYATRTIRSDSGSSIQLQMDPQTGRTIAPAFQASRHLGQCHHQAAPDRAVQA